MNEHEYIELIENNPRITFGGFKTRVTGFERGINQLVHAGGREYMKDHLFSVFIACCDYVQIRRRFPRRYSVERLKTDMEQRLGWRNVPLVNPDIPLGVMMLALINEGYVIRQCRGTSDGRIIRRKP